jgi:hypothetical protein
VISFPLLPLYPWEKAFRTPWAGGWVDHRAALGDVEEILDSTLYPKEKTFKTVKMHAYKLSLQRQSFLMEEENSFSSPAPWICLHAYHKCERKWLKAPAR